MLPFTYEPETGQILEIEHDRAFEGLHDPATSISEETMLVTGITREMLEGRRIDAEVNLVVAHNAAFDRQMAEKHWNCFAYRPWSCSLASVDWLRE